MTEDVNIFLVDTNCYVRIARASTSILGDHAGLQLRLIESIADECGRSNRLKNAMPWMLQPPHPANRALWTVDIDAASEKLISKAKRELRDALEDTLEDYARQKRGRGDNRAVLSGPDKALFYTAFALEWGMVTDEGPLTLACKEFDIPHLTSLEVLKQLTELEAISRKQVDGIVRHWQYENDTPKDWKKSYLSLFGEPIPFFNLDSD